MNWRRMFIAALAAPALLLMGTWAFGQESSSYDLTWNRVGGGVSQSSATYGLTATVGQAATARSSQGRLEVAAGFWRFSSTVFVPAIGLAGLVAAGLGVAASSRRARS